MSRRVGSGRPPARRDLGAAAFTIGLIAAVVWLGLSAQPGSGPIVLVERWSSELTNALTSAGTRLSLGFAFVAGLVAAFNPCGFAVLPAYLGLYLGDGTAHQGDAGARLRRVLVVSAVVTAAFVLLFGVVGLFVQMASSILTPNFPRIGLIVGILLVVAGGWTLAGRALPLTAGPAVADKLGRSAGRGGVWGYAAFGLAYGAASLGCTLPIFLAVIGTSFAQGSSVGKFVLFGVGMATSITAVTIAFGMTSAKILRTGRRAGRWVAPISGALLMLAGAYVTFYWLSLGRLA